MSATDEYIRKLIGLKSGELALLRTHAGQGLDESVEGFDLFAGNWWPLREKSERAPRREVAWLIAKLYAFSPLGYSPEDELPLQLGRLQPRDPHSGQRFQCQFDNILTLPLSRLEPALRWALQELADNDKKLDWARLADDLSRWERESTRLKWAGQYLKNAERM